MNIPSGNAILSRALQPAQAVINVVNQISDVLDDGGNVVSAVRGFSTPSIIGGPPYPNILETFASYTPLFTLACLTPEQFNNPATYRGLPGAIQNVVFSSAGRFSSERARTVGGAPEYFVDNFVIEHTTAATKKTGNSNVVKLSFEVYEPYSMGYFLQSLLSAAIAAGYPFYKEAPFLLKLEFVGYRQDGSIFMSTENLAKYFIIQLNNATFTTNEGGSTYKLDATPMNHTGWSTAAGMIYNDLTLRGETVKEMLVSGDVSLCAALNKSQKDLVDKEQQSIPDEYLVVFPEAWDDKVGLPVGGAIQPVDAASWDPKTQLSGGNLPTSARPGSVSGDFGNGPIGSAPGGDLGFGPASGGNYNFGFESDVVDANGNIIRDKLTIDPKQRAFQFAKNTSIQNIINSVVLSSKYAKDAIDPQKADAEGRLKWFRVDVQIQLLGLDTIRNTRARRYVFRVLPFMVHSSVFRNATAAPIGYEQLNKIIGKEYFYLYTGQNNNLLKFDITINQLFHQGRPTSAPQQSGTVVDQNTQQIAEDAGNKAKVSSKGQAIADSLGQGTTIKPDPAANEQNSKGGRGATDVSEIVARALKNAIENNGEVNGDLVMAKLEILGDPYWISDNGMGNYIGDAYNGPGSMRTLDNSMNYQGTDTYIRVIFRTPVEPNLGLTGRGGLYNFPEGEKENPFSGIYKVNTAITKVSGGVVTQELQTVRMPLQPADFVQAVPATAANAGMYDTKEENKTGEGSFLSAFGVDFFDF